MPSIENTKQIKSGQCQMKPLKPFRQLLDRCKVEDDVRAAYAKFFDIPFDASEYIDLYTPQVLFEFKYDRNLSRTREKAKVLAQSLYYVRRLRYGDIDELQTKGATLFSTDETTFVAQWLANRIMSAQSAELLACGKEIYKYYFAHLNELRTTKFKIQTWDAGWYQIRMALQDVNLAADLLEQRKLLHRILRDKLLPQLYEYGIISCF